MKLKGSLLLFVLCLSGVNYAACAAYDHPILNKAAPSANDSSLPSINPVALSSSGSAGLDSLNYQYDPSSGDISYTLATPYLNLAYDLNNVALHPYGLANGWRVSGMPLMYKAASQSQSPYGNILFLGDGTTYHYAEPLSPGKIALVNLPDNHIEFFKTDGSQVLSKYTGGTSDFGQDPTVGYVLVSDESAAYHLDSGASDFKVNDPDTFLHAYGVTRSYFDQSGNLLATVNTSGGVNYYLTGGNIAKNYPQLSDGEVLLAVEDAMRHISGIIYSDTDGGLRIGPLVKSGGNYVIDASDASRSYLMIVSGSPIDSNNVTGIVTPVMAIGQTEADSYHFRYDPYSTFENQGTAQPGIESMPASITLPSGATLNAYRKDESYQENYGLSSYLNKTNYTELEDSGQTLQFPMPGVGLTDQQDPEGKSLSSTYGGMLDTSVSGLNGVTPDYNASVGKGATTALGPAIPTKNMPFLATTNLMAPYTQAMYNQSAWLYFGSNDDFAIMREVNGARNISDGNELGMYSDLVSNHLGLPVEAYSHYVDQVDQKIDQPLMRSLTQYTGVTADASHQGQFSNFAAYDKLASNYYLPQATYQMLYSNDGQSVKTHLSTRNYADDGYGTLLSQTSYLNNSTTAYAISADGKQVNASIAAPDNADTWQVSPDQANQIKDIYNDNHGFSAQATVSNHFNACLDGSNNLCNQSVTEDQATHRQLFTENETNHEGELIKTTHGYVDDTGDYHAVTATSYRYYNDLDGSNALEINGNHPLLLKSSTVTLLDPSINEDTSDATIQKLDEALPKGQTSQETDYYYSYQQSDTATPYDLSAAVDTQGHSVIEQNHQGDQGLDNGVLVITSAIPGGDSDQSAWVSREYISYHTGRIFMTESAHMEYQLDDTGKGSTEANIGETTYDYDSSGRVTEVYDHLSQTAIENGYGDHSKGSYSDISSRNHVILGSDGTSLVLTAAKKSDYDDLGRLTAVYDSQTVDANNTPTHLLYQYLYESSDHEPSTDAVDQFNAENKLIAKTGYGYASDSSGNLTNQAVVTETYHYNHEGQVDVTRDFNGSPALSDYYNDKSPALIRKTSDFSDDVLQSKMRCIDKIGASSLSNPVSGKIWYDDQGNPVASVSGPLSSDGTDITTPAAVEADRLTMAHYDNLGAMQTSDTYLDLPNASGNNYHLIHHSEVSYGDINNPVEEKDIAYADDSDASISLSDHSFSTGNNGSSYEVFRNNDPNGDQLTYATGDIDHYDSFGRVISTAKPYLLSGNTSVLNAQPQSCKTYRYDDNGNIVSSSDFMGNLTTYTYNAQNQLTDSSVTDNKTHETVSYHYNYYCQGDKDNAGNVRNDLIGLLKNRERQESGFATSSITVPKSDSFIAYQYTDRSEAYRISEVDEWLDTANAGGRPDFEEAYQYDANGRLIKRTDINQLTGHQFSNLYAYDNTATDEGYGQLSEIDQSDSLSFSGNGNRTWTFKYYKNADSPDYAGEIKKVEMTDPTDSDNNYKIKYTYFGLPDKPTLTDLRQKGRLASKAILNNTGSEVSAITYQYDAEGRTHQVTYRSQTSSSSASNYDICYSYDAQSHLVKEVHNAASGDLLAQISYQYDPVTGNIVSSDHHNYQTQTDEHKTYQYDPVTHTPISVTVNGSVMAFNTDVNGNFASDDKGHGFFYDVEGHLIAVTGTSPDAYQVIYSYWPDGTRQSKAVDEGSDHLVEYYSYDQVGTGYPEVTLEVEQYQNRFTEAASVLVNDQHLARIVTADSGSGYSEQVDNLFSDGKSTLVLASNNQWNYLNYSAYGVWLNPDESPSPLIKAVSLDNNPYGYDGEQSDPESGLVYLRARYYSPSLSLFIQRDPDHETFNKYAAFNGDPIRLTDPSGMDPWYSYLSDLTRGISNTITGLFGVTFSGDRNGGWHYSGAWGGEDGLSTYAASLLSLVPFAGQYFVSKVQGASDSEATEAGFGSLPVVGSVFNAVKSGTDGNYHDMTENVSSAVTQVALFTAGGEADSEDTAQVAGNTKLASLSNQVSWESSGNKTTGIGCALIRNSDGKIVEELRQFSKESKRVLTQLRKDLDNPGDHRIVRFFRTQGNGSSYTYDFTTKTLTRKINPIEGYIDDSDDIDDPQPSTFYFDKSFETSGIGIQATLKTGETMPLGSVPLNKVNEINDLSEMRGGAKYHPISDLKTFTIGQKRWTYNL